ncbi:MAG TPA: hypothetical protein VHD95_15140, partial [Rhizomicrobium sp.]|nr:hypothetical protein [Rhizomicrobium sp.]
RQDARWPKACEKCHRSFEDQDTFQVFQDQLYRRLDSGELVAKRFAPAGALWFLDGQERRYYEGIFPGGGPDGQFLMARTPGGDWCIDSRASNCTMKTDKVHRCWVRHGDPKTGKVTVDKNGNTCQAGGGSIISGGYHGFLRNGEFVPA